MNLRLPSLHSIHWKVFVFHLTVMIVPLVYVAMQVRSNFEKSYLHSTEAGMIDTAAVISELYGRIVAENRADPQTFKELGETLAQTSKLKGWIFRIQDADVDTFFILYDAEGRIVYDSRPARALNQSYAHWRDVRIALGGRYGARWELQPGGSRVYLYSTLPVTLDNKVVGAVSVVKPTNRIRNFISHSLWKLALPAFAAILFAAGLAYMLSAYITRIIKDLAQRASRVAKGESDIRLDTWTRSELGDLARAIDRMRRKLEGKAYVEETVANLSHELKTPLAAIRGAAEVLEVVPLEDTAAREKFLGNIQTEVRRLDDIVENMLTLARIDSAPSAGPIAPLDLAEVLKTKIGGYSATAQSLGIEFQAELPDKPAMVRVPEFYFLQMVENLVHNALNFTPAGGRVSLSLLPKGEMVFLKVTDTGKGIEAEFLPKIWGRFFTTDNPRSGGRGTGLGLAIVRSIALSYRGEVSAESMPGRGSTFRVRFPLASTPGQN